MALSKQVFLVLRIIFLTFVPTVFIFYKYCWEASLKYIRLKEHGGVYSVFFKQDVQQIIQS